MHTRWTNPPGHLVSLESRSNRFLRPRRRRRLPVSHDSLLHVEVSNEIEKILGPTLLGPSEHIGQPASVMPVPVLSIFGDDVRSARKRTAI